MYLQALVVHQNIIFLMPKKQKSTTSSMLNIKTNKNTIYFFNT